MVLFDNAMMELSSLTASVTLGCSLALVTLGDLESAQSWILTLASWASSSS